MFNIQLIYSLFTRALRQFLFREFFYNYMIYDWQYTLNCKQIYVFYSRCGFIKKSLLVTFHRTHLRNHLDKKTRVANKDLQIHWQQYLVRISPVISNAKKELCRSVLCLYFFISIIKIILQCTIFINTISIVSKYISVLFIKLKSFYQLFIRYLILFVNNLRE